MVRTRCTHSLLVSILGTLAILASVSASRAAWTPDGNALCTAPYGQHLPVSCPDGAGGAIIAWYDYRAGTGVKDMYVQRVDEQGNPLWTANGVALCTAAGDQLNQQIISDGLGGAIVVWEDARVSPPDIYAQRVNASGVPLWSANGVAVCSGNNIQSLPVITSDGANGAIIAWQDYRSVSTFDIYAQRVNATGSPLWTANGIAIVVGAGTQDAQQIASDGAGGAIVTWEDTRSGVFHPYAQRVNASGVQWGANGVSLCNAGGGQGLPRILADGAGGAFVAWVDTRNSDNDIFAQRVNSAGVAQWTTDGVPVVVYATYTQTNPLLVSDGAGGAIVTWEDYRASNADLYAQRLSATGFRMWQPLTGVPVVAVANAQTHATVASDNAGGVIVAWDDARIGSDADIYAQRLNNQGVARWTANGVALSKPLFDQLSPCVSLNGTGAIVGWNDIRNGNDYDIYAARVDIEEGYVGHPEPQIVSVADVKADQGGHVKVNWTASGWDVRHLNTIDHYSIWRAVDAGAFQSAMRAGAVSDLAKIGADFHGSAVRKQTGPNQTSYYWEWVGNQNILYANGYSFSAETRADSTSQSPATHYFQVVSHTANPYLFWPSNVVSGRSVDNLAPIAPLALTAQRIGSYVYLKWNGVHLPDLKKYTVYRKTSTGVTAIPANFLSDATDTLLTDSSAPASALYYVVTASDVHENQGSASNEANVAAATGVGNLPPLAVLQVLQNRPNPFAGATDLQIGLPTASKVDIAVYDIAGRRVRTITINETAAGWKSVPFDARNDAGEPLASGVYFCRVSAAGKTVTHKMVIAH